MSSVAEEPNIDKKLNVRIMRKTERVVKRIIEDVLTNTPVLLTGFPGTNKTGVLIKVALKLAREGYFVIYAVPTHEIRDSVARRILRILEKHKYSTYSLKILFIHKDLVENIDEQYKKKLGLLSHAEACGIEASNEREYYAKLSQHLREVKENNTECFYRKHIKAFINWLVRRINRKNKKKKQGGIIVTTYQMSFIARSLIKSLISNRSSDKSVGSKKKIVLIIDEADEFYKYINIRVPVKDIEFIKNELKDPDLYERVKRYFDKYFKEHNGYYYIELYYLMPDIMATATERALFPIFIMLENIDPKWREYTKKKNPEDIDIIQLRLPKRKPINKDFIFVLRKYVESENPLILSDSILEIISYSLKIGMRVLVVTRTLEHQKLLRQKLEEILGRELHHFQKYRYLEIITVNDAKSRGINLIKRIGEINKITFYRDMDLIIAEYQQGNKMPNKTDSFYKTLHPALKEILAGVKGNDLIYQTVKLKTYADNFQAVFRGARIHDPDRRASPFPRHYIILLDKRHEEAIDAMAPYYLENHVIIYETDTVEEIVEKYWEQVRKDLEFIQKDEEARLRLERFVREFGINLYVS